MFPLVSLSMIIDPNVLWTTNVIPVLVLPLYELEKFTIRAILTDAAQMHSEPYPPILQGFLYITTPFSLARENPRLLAFQLLGGPKITTYRYTGPRTKLPITFISSPFFSSMFHYGTATV